MDRIRIVYCIDNMGIGGTELNAVRTAERLDRSRFDVSVLSLSASGPLLERYAAAGIPVRTVELPRLHGLTAMRGAVEVVRWFRRERIQIVQSHDFYNNIFSVACARMAQVPVAIASRRWWHAPPRRAHIIGNRLGFRAAHIVLANSPAVARLVHETDNVPAERIVTVPNFVDESAFVPPAESVLARWRAELQLPPGALVLGAVANLTPIKDHGTLIDAFSSLARSWPTLHLVLVGEGPCRSTILERATRLGVDRRVHLTGSRPEFPSFHHLFDVSALSSLSEGFPNSIVEAMAAGKPVVATATGGIPDAVRVNETGLLVPPGDAAALSGAIGTLLDDPGRRQRMGAAGKQRARESYDSARVLPALQDLYEHLVNGAAARRPIVRRPVAVAGSEGQ